MYTNFFSLSELPFSIAPNPKYLFMSDRHREALTHLTSGLGGSGKGASTAESTGGFVLLTGEVGTGKTTVSRCLMDDLPQNTQLAFILNPTLSSQELLATICDQLKIRYRKTGATSKTLTDKISEKLLKNHEDNINTLLIIDEAQHLAPQVLEQLRLLTNLETNTRKLLQVILIGQPELQQLLKRRDLRQLAQRITARYHLLPLNKQELAAYIKHRLSIADCHRALFNDAAISAIHQLSQGIPRLINLICHSALMNAYNSNNAVVSKKIVYQAASQALGDDFELPQWWRNTYVKLAGAVSVLCLVLFLGVWVGQEKQPIALISTAQHTNESLEKSLSPPVAAVAEQTPISIEQPSLVSTRTETTLPIEQSAALTVEPPKVTQAISPEQPLAKTSAQPKPEENYQVAKVDGVSEDLLAMFQAAIDETANSDNTSANNAPMPAAIEDIKPLTQMPAWVQKGIPNLTFEQHIYASDGQGWVTVNGRDRYEGDVVADGLTINKILPQQVILTYRGEKFSLPALTNW